MIVCGGAFEPHRRGPDTIIDRVFVVFLAELGDAQQDIFALGLESHALERQRLRLVSCHLEGLDRRARRLSSCDVLEHVDAVCRIGLVIIDDLDRQGVPIAGTVIA